MFWRATYSDLTKEPLEDQLSLEEESPSAVVTLDELKEPPATALSRPHEDDRWLEGSDAPSQHLFEERRSQAGGTELSIEQPAPAAVQPHGAHPIEDSKVRPPRDTLKGPALDFEPAFAIDSSAQAPSGAADYELSSSRSRLGRRQVVGALPLAAVMLALLTLLAGSPAPQPPRHSHPSALERTEGITRLPGARIARRRPRRAARRMRPTAPAPRRTARPRSPEAPAAAPPVRVRPIAPAPTKPAPPPPASHPPTPPAPAPSPKAPAAPAAGPEFL